LQLEPDAVLNVAHAGGAESADGENDEGRPDRNGDDASHQHATSPWNHIRSAAICHSLRPAGQPPQAACRQPGKRIKVFCFFFSKKKP
jgi:hypothetical protein